MHFVTGGAYNGKSKWVRSMYDGGIDWRSAYKGRSWNEATFNENVIVLEGFEEWMVPLVAMREDFKDMRESVQSYLKSWIAWEREALERKIIVIGTDITKGIVPSEKESRALRDAVGWAYQDLTAVAERVDVVWYGLNQQIK